MNPPPPSPVGHFGGWKKGGKEVVSIDRAHSEKKRVDEPIRNVTPLWLGEEKGAKAQWLVTKKSGNTLQNWKLLREEKEKGLGARSHMPSRKKKERVNKGRQSLPNSEKKKRHRRGREKWAYDLESKERYHRHGGWRNWAA